MLKPLLAWVDQQKAAARPFLLGVLTVTAHHPYDPPRHWQMLDLARDRKRNKYLNTLRYTDQFLADLHQGLKDRDLLDNALFVFMGDHGEGFGEHGLFQHDVNVYEEGIRVPLILLGPGLGAPRRVAGRWQNIDVMPTVLNALDLRVVAGELPGRSILAGVGHDKLFFSCWHDKRCLAVLEGDEKTIWHYDRRRPEVFDLRADPQEKHSLTNARSKAAMDARIADMKAWQDAVNGSYQSQDGRRQHVSAGRRRPQLRHGVDIVFGDFLRLIGWEIDRTEVRAGQPVRLKLAFEVLKKPQPDWRVFVHVEGPAGAMFKVDHVPSEGAFPASKWQPGIYFVDSVPVRFDRSTVSGNHLISIGLFDPDGKKNRRARPQGRGLPIEFVWRVRVATVTVHNPKRPEPIADLRPVGRASLPAALRGRVGGAPPVAVSRVEARFGDAVELIATSVPAAPVKAGAEIELTWWFRCLQVPERATQVFTHVLGPRKHYINGSHVPLEGAYAPERWQVGDVIEDHHKVRVPATAPAGPHELWVGFWNPYSAEPLGRLEVAGVGRIEQRRLYAGRVMVTR